MDNVNSIWDGVTHSARLTLIKECRDIMATEIDWKIVFVRRETNMYNYSGFHQWYSSLGFFEKEESESKGISASGSRTVREPRVVVQTTSDIVWAESCEGQSRSKQVRKPMFSATARRLHREGKLMSGVDLRLGGEFDEGEMRRVLLIGLVCSHPDPLQRPAMKGVVQMLGGDVEVPIVPTTKPSMSFISTSQLLLTLQDTTDSISVFQCGITITILVSLELVKNV
ncbi:hypothetical protein Syun_012457 [Stephania yunnanensis]|uniref:Uncharacterized protein n=1 Tax=Stephania yunnanensis TaxID=152371 RepID=A0AAP0K1V1_9MAGN